MRGKQDHTFERELRRTRTEAEARLWLYMRNQRTFDNKFRRQHRIGPYVVDFFCASANLVLEIDGSHLEAETYDLVRTAYLNWRGYRVLRFWNNEVLARTGDVLEVIAQALKAEQKQEQERPSSALRAPSPRCAGRRKDESTDLRVPSPR